MGAGSEQGPQPQPLTDLDLLGKLVALLGNGSHSGVERGSIPLAGEAVSERTISSGNCAAMHTDGI
jgi:hypothetical protein